MYSFFKFLLCKHKAKKTNKHNFLKKKLYKTKKTYVFKEKKECFKPYKNVNSFLQVSKKNITIYKKKYTFFKSKSPQTS